MDEKHHKNSEGLRRFQESSQQDWGLQGLPSGCSEGVGSHARKCGLGLALAGERTLAEAMEERTDGLGPN